MLAAVELTIMLLHPQLCSSVLFMLSSIVFVCLSHLWSSVAAAVMSGCHSCSSAACCCPPMSPVCESVCACASICESVHPCSGSVHSILLWLPLVPLTCHPCSMTACRRWPGMVWDMEYPWAKLDCKILPASSTLGMMPTNIHPFIHSFGPLMTHYN